MAYPTAADVVAFLDRTGDVTTLSLAEAQIPIVAETVRAYTRDRGFTDGTPQ